MSTEEQAGPNKKRTAGIKAKRSGARLSAEPCSNCKCRRYGACKCTKKGQKK